MIFRSGSAIEDESEFCKLSRELEMSIDAHFENIQIIYINATHVVESSISRRRDDNGNNLASATTDTTRGEEETRENARKSMRKLCRETTLVRPRADPPPNLFVPPR